MNPVVRTLTAFLGVALILGGCGQPAGLIETALPSPTPTVASVPARAGGAEVLAPITAARRAPQPAIAGRLQAVLVADHCVERDVLAPAPTDVTLTVLDRTYALEAGYVPPDLAPASSAGFEGTSGDKLIRAIVMDDLAAMRSAWQAAGMHITIYSAYRSAASQTATFDSWVARLGYADGLLRSARPGHSEHQLGTAIDVTSPGWVGRIGDWAADTADGAWMAEHAWEYGFVMSYPAASTTDTCFGYEPWHYRWIGREAAAEHRASGLPLRRFLERFATG